MMNDFNNIFYQYADRKYEVMFYWRGGVSTSEYKTWLYDLLQTVNLNSEIHYSNQFANSIGVNNIEDLMLLIFVFSELIWYVRDTTSDNMIYKSCLKRQQ